MSRKLLVMMLVAALCALPGQAMAIGAPVPTSGAALAGAESGLDGELVTIEGEVVSEVLKAGDGHVWVNVLSEGTAIGVWVPAELVHDLTVFGDWKHTGDRIVVTGVFNQACDVHGGDLDLHATSIVLLERGAERRHPVAFWKLGVGAGGVALALLGYRRMRRLEEGD